MFKDSTSATYTLFRDVHWSFLELFFVQVRICYVMECLQKNL